MSSLLDRIQELTGRFLGNRRAGAASAGSAVLLGFLFLVWTGLGGGLCNLSYDFPFVIRAMLPGLQPAAPTNEAVVVYMDDKSHRELPQPWLQPWDRRIHADLVDVLRTAHAKAVVFDLLFDQPATNDAVLARAAAAYGAVFLGAEFETLMQGKVAGLTLVPPVQRLREVAAWGPVEAAAPDRAIRQHYRGDFQSNTLAWTVAKATVPTLGSEPFAPRWMNYYGPALALPHHSFVDVLRTNTPLETFSNKVVFVGAQPQVGFTGGGGAGSDDFRTPYTNWSEDKKRSPGVEILATAYLNLARDDWLRRTGPWTEVLLILLAGLSLGFGFMAARPTVAIGAALAMVAGLAALACLTVWRWQFWFPWAVIAYVQVPITLAGSLLVNVGQLRRNMELLEQKLATALSERLTLLPMPQRKATSVTTPNAPPGAPVPPAAPAIPNHEMLRCIGRGAYGEVWLARDEIGSYHAVKVVHRGSFSDSGPFDREFRGIQQYTPISRTHHGLVHILHVGRNKEAGYFFYIMELGDCEVSGQTVVPETYCAKNLGRELDRRGKLPVKECVHLAMELAEALHYLHSKQLIHRDIKPSNIIFVNGLPKFADVGLVTHVAERGRDVTFLGTEGFIAPEGPGTPGADVFSLGKVIYEACMGRSAAQYPELPSALTQHEELDELLALNEIILKACDPELRRRYSTAAELQSDLMRLNDRLYGGAQRAHP